MSCVATHHQNNSIHNTQHNSGRKHKLIHFYDSTDFILKGLRPEDIVPLDMNALENLPSSDNGSGDDIVSPLANFSVLAD